MQTFWRTRTFLSFIDGYTEDGNTIEVADCYVDGYGAGFINEYDKDRAEVCEEIRKDWYNMSRENGCIDSTKQDCDNIKEGNDSDT